MSEELLIRELPNGMTLLGQRMEGVSSATMTFLLPGGASHDPEEAAGAAAVLCEWCLRGAGERDTRQLNDALDCLGCQHRETPLSEHVQFSAAQLGRNLPEVLAIYADILRRPRLEDAAFEPCRALIEQDLAVLEDEPIRKCSVLVQEKFYPHPLGRCVYGRSESLRAMTAQTVRRHWKDCFAPNGALLAVAGNVDWDRFCGLAERHFADWQSSPSRGVELRPPEGGISHVRKQSAQVHVALAHRSVAVCDRHFYAARMAETVLSGGMSSRLFAEVRDRRGLAYHVGSEYHSLKHHAGMFTYLGTTPQRAQEALEATVAELRRLPAGIEEEEMARARTQLKTAIVMQGESTVARAGALAGDWYHLRRLRSLQELSQAIDRVTVADILAYLEQCPPARFTMLVIGPEPLDGGGMSG